MNQITEENFAEINMGVSRATLARARHVNLKEGEDWSREGGKIVYTESGCLKTLEFFKVKKNAPRAQQVANSTVPVADGKKTRGGAGTLEIFLKIKEPSEIGESVELVICNFCRNPRLLFARDAEGHRVRVRVKSSTVFTAGTKIKARHDHDDVYWFEGVYPKRKRRAA
jgi:hypothetical protein